MPGDGRPGGTGGVALQRRAFLKAAGATSLATSVAGCAVGLGGGSTQNTVQFVADSGAKEVQGDINKALHEAGLSEDVSVQILAVSSDTAQQQFSQWLSAGLERPSLLRMDSGWTIPFILRNQVANLSEAMPELASSVTENYFEASVSTVTGPNGDVFGVPLFSDFGLMLYRKDLVEQAGYDPSGWATSPLSWKRFAEIVRKTMDQSDVQYGYTFQAMVYEGLPCCTFNELMASWGGSYFGARENLFGPVGERPVTVDAEPVVRAARMGRTFINGSDDQHALDGFAGGISPRAVLQWDEDPSLSPFVEGNAVAHRNWPYSVLESGAGEALGENLGVMPLPYGVQQGQAQFEGMGGSVAALGGWNVCLNPNARHREEAIEVLRAMSSDSFYLTLLELLGYVPPKPALLDTDQAQNVEVMGRYLDTLKQVGENAVPRPVTVVWPQEAPRIAQQVSAVLSGDAAPRAAMTELARLLKQIEEGGRR